MVERNVFLRIKCGEIYILSNNEFSLACKFCEHGFHSLEDLSAHLIEHFSDSPTNIKNEDSLKYNAIESFVDLLDDSDEILSTDGSVSSINLNVTGQSEQSVQPNLIRELQSNSDNEKRNTTEPNEFYNGSPKQLEKRKSALMPTDTNHDHIIIETHPGNVMDVPKYRKNQKKKITTNLKCIFCGQTFLQKKELNIHENKHIGPHKCHICFRPFAATRLRRHILTHSRSIRTRLEKLGLITTKEQIICLQNTFRAHYAISNKRAKKPPVKKCDKYIQNVYNLRRNET